MCNLGSAQFEQAKAKYIFFHMISVTDGKCYILATGELGGSR
jgi:hypothetical protein